MFSYRLVHSIFYVITKVTNAENMITVTAASGVCREIPLSRNPVDSLGSGRLVGSLSSSEHGS